MGSDEDEMKTFQRIIGVPGLGNLGVVKEGAIYRSAQPELFEALPQYLEVRRVLNLRAHSDKELAGGTGILVYDFPLNVFSNISVSDFDYALTIMKECRQPPILVHCRQGQDRTGVICACYRVAVDGWSLDDALEEMQAYGFNDLWFVLKGSLETYVKEKGLC